MYAFCANCSTPAKFLYVITANTKTPYCQKHLPKFLLSSKYAGRVEKVVPVTEPVVPTASPKKKKATAPAPTPVVEEPVEDQPVIEEVVEEASPEVAEGE
jgi:hypothetical protein